MEKCKLVLVYLFLFILFSFISAQETQTKPNKKDGVVIKPSSGAKIEPFKVSEVDKAYYEALGGHYSAGIEFLKKYPDDYRKTNIINNMLARPVDYIGYDNHKEGKLRLSPDWKYGLFNDNSGRQMLLNLESNVIEKVFKNMGGSKYSPDGKKLIGIGSVPKPSERDYPPYLRGCGPSDFNGVIRIYNSDNGKLIKHIDWKLKNQQERAVSVDFTKDCTKILSCSRKAVALWDYETGKQIVEYSVPNANFIVARISEDHKY
ncbi:MAG: hypothetical protein K8S87_10610, partial [Planctomycetes bacterium]|nr:hypothetical protein [Planctomycetota bacterium]